MTPSLIIVAGPTGSGKTSLPKKIADYLNTDLKHDRVNALIDNYVEQNPAYANSINKFIVELCGKDYEKDPQKMECKKLLKEVFLNPSQKALEYFNKAYIDARFNTICMGNNAGDPIKESKEETCDRQNTIAIQRGLENGKDVILETIGTQFPFWLFEYYGEPILRNNYKVIMAWTTADICSLILRNKTRAINSLSDYLDKNSKAPPRLANINYKAYKNIIKEIIAEFHKIIKGCSGGINKKFCQHNIHFLVFDNRTTDSNVVYDSLKHSLKDAEAAINLYGIDNEEPCDLSNFNEDEIEEYSLARQRLFGVVHSHPGEISPGRKARASSLRSYVSSKRRGGYHKKTKKKRIN